MIYESSYDSGRLPYKPDLTRGYWNKPSDFVYTGISLAFRQDIFSLAWIFFTTSGGACILPYVCYLVLFVMPLFVMQSFLGQFSSSGFISAFRIAPLFKGIGYISLGVNFGVLTYYSVFAAIPLLYLFHSLRPTLPWSCEGLKDWAYNFTEYDVKHICHLASNESKELGNGTWYGAYQVPSILFLRSRFKHKDLFNYTESDIAISWEIVLCTLLVWGIIAALFYKWNNIEKVSRYLRYCIFTTLTLLCICVLRFSLLPSSPLQTIFNFFMPSPESLPAATTFVMSAFGAGWGTVIVLASYNKFKTNIVENSWNICFGQMLTFFAFAFLTFIVNEYFAELSVKEEEEVQHVVYISQHWALYLSTGSVLANMELSNLWCIIFYTMLMLAAIVTMMTNLLCTLQSLFDEFERFRERKNDVTMIVIGLLAVCSLYTCTSDGVFYHTMLGVDTLVTQTALNLLLIFVVLWVYGRLRFQRDIEFMLSQTFATWKVYMLRFVSPLFLIILLGGLLIAAFIHHIFGTIALQIAALFFIVLPWLYIPGYMIYILIQTTGTAVTRFKRCCRPMDWYPVELEERQRYEESMQNAEMSHQLSQFAEVTEVP